MVGHGSLWPVLLSVMLVPLLLLGLPRRRLAGLETPVLFSRLAFVARLRIVGSLPFLLQSRPARCHPQVEKSNFGGISATACRRASE